MSAGEATREPVKEKDRDRDRERERERERGRERQERTTAQFLANGAIFFQAVRANLHGPVSRISASQIDIDRRTRSHCSVARYNAIACAHVDRHILTENRERERERTKEETGTSGETRRRMRLESAQPHLPTLCDPVRHPPSS